MPDVEKVIKGLESQLDDLRKYADVDEVVTLTQNQAKDIIVLLKGQLQIVLCKDCKRWYPNGGDCDHIMSDWFCANGERAENARSSNSEIPNS